MSSLPHSQPPQDHANRVESESTVLFAERMVPETTDSGTFWEHIYRYRFAVQFVPGQRVLDVASGEGYGTASLVRGGAVDVVGVDISAEACGGARRKYHLDFRVGAAENIPLPDDSRDVVVSFETLEHLASPELLIEECRRVLVPGGRLIISTPNREVSKDNRNINPFHIHEINEQEFVTLLLKHFARYILYFQRPVSAKWWNPRSLVALSTPWRDVPGFWRTRQWLTGLLCPHLVGEVAAKYRRSPVEAILEPGNRMSFLANPYEIRGRIWRGSEKPGYFIAVAWA